jgi:hypothetical protein
MVEPVCKNCKFWEDSQCVDPDADYDENGNFPKNGWRCTDIMVGIITGPLFGCVRFKQS